MELTVRVIHVNIQQTDQANHFLKTGKVTTQIIFCFLDNNMDHVTWCFCRKIFVILKIKFLFESSTKKTLLQAIWKIFNRDVLRDVTHDCSSGTFIIKKITLFPLPRCYIKIFPNRNSKKKSYFSNREISTTKK